MGFRGLGFRAAGFRAWGAKGWVFRVWPGLCRVNGEGFRGLSAGKSSERRGVSGVQGRTAFLGV